MSRAEYADWLERAADDPAMARATLKELANAVRDYRAQTHVETYALEEILEAAQEAVHKVHA